MILDLREFDQFPVEVELAADEGELEPFAPEVVNVGQVDVTLAIQKTGNEFFCQGTVTADATVECSRCLKPVRKSLEGPMDFIIRPDSYKPERGDALDDEDYVMLPHGDLRADMTPILRQTLLLALEMMPLCSESCRGLCPVCRKNRNEEMCSCVVPKTDERWSALRSLQDRQSL